MLFSHKHWKSGAPWWAEALSNHSYCLKTAHKIIHRKTLCCLFFHRSCTGVCILVNLTAQILNSRKKDGHSFYEVFVTLTKHIGRKYIFFPIKKSKQKNFLNPPKTPETTSKLCVTCFLNLSSCGWFHTHYINWVHCIIQIALYYFLQ